MQIQFGSWWQRLRRGGVLLSPIEQSVLAAFREAMPPEFHAAIDAQLEDLNLTQRDVQWKGVCFYRILNGRASRDGLLPLPCKDGEVKLLSVSFRVLGHKAPVHVAFWAVDRILSGFATDVSLKPYKSEVRLTVDAIKHAWRSNFTPECDRRV